MLLLIKTLLPVVLLLSAIAQHIADYVWHDKRTTLHRRAKITLLMFQVVFGVGTIVLVVKEHNASEESAVAIANIRKEAKENADASAARDSTSQAELSNLQRQVRELNTHLEPFVQVAIARYPGLPESSALNRLTTDLAELRNRTTRLERKIHSIAVTVQLVLEGEWADGLSRGLETALDMPNDPYVKFLQMGVDHRREILFYPTAISRHREGHDQVIVNFEASVRSGGWPLGQTVDVLNGYRNAQIGVAMIERRNAKPSDVILKEAHLKVFINGVLEVSRADSLDTVISLPENGIRVLNLEGVDFLAPASKKN